MQQATQYADKEILSDLLIAEKQLTSTCNTWAGECSSDQLRNAFLNVLDDTHRIQASLFRSMQSRGWYPTETAEAAKIQQTKQMLSGS
ncbi:MAG: spore coat protein [Oscillospiraceae bacterium]|jgi:spore coat protein CotF|nr:spore coat protein [Oscillospiraceae bacterium]